MQDLHTPRLILKPVTPALIHKLFRTQSPEAIMAFFGCDEKGYERYKAMHEQGMETRRISLFFFLLVNRQTGLPIGECGFNNWAKVHARAELFYSLNHDADKRQGYTTEALEVILQYGFTELGLHRIEALAAGWNTPSIKLLQRYGFIHEGTLREHYCYEGKWEDSEIWGLLAKEWAAR